MSGLKALLQSDFLNAVNTNPDGRVDYVKTNEPMAKDKKTGEYETTTNGPVAQFDVYNKGEHGTIEKTRVSMDRDELQKAFSTEPDSPHFKHNMEQFKAGLTGIDNFSPVSAIMANNFEPATP